MLSIIESRFRFRFEIEIKSVCIVCVEAPWRQFEGGDKTT